MTFTWMARSMAALLFVFFAIPAQAQFDQAPQPQQAPDVSDEDLQTFVDASILAQQIQTEAQMEMIAIVEEEGLDVQTYNEILQGMQRGEDPEELEISSDNVEKFEKASELIGEIEQQMEVELIAAIEDEGLSLDRYQEIFAAVQTNPELQQKMQQMIQEAQMQQGGQPGGF
ncbi:DUF4168 domain-containing protein [Balneolales bacterium ANBcel1]|nr:DUF4168 domain-containing protein [Balneolales bacterium ANBcel1]